jgi:hypothetical protein
MTHLPTLESLVTTRTLILTRFQPGGHDPHGLPTVETVFTYLTHRRDEVSTTTR